MDQGSPEWHQWRSQGVCASDSPILLNVSDYGDTPYTLWLEKSGRTLAKSIPVFANAKGSFTEAQIRARLGLELGVVFQAVCAQHDQYPWLRASMDAVGATYDNPTHLIAAEIKFLGAAKLEQVRQGIIPRAHVIQMQHQMLVLDIPAMWYCAASEDAANYVRVLVRADKVLQSEIMVQALKFYSHMINDTEPEKTEDDWWTIEDKTILQLVKEASDPDSHTAKAIQTIRSTIKDEMPHRKIIVGDYKLSKSASGALRIMALA